MTNLTELIDATNNRIFLTLSAPLTLFGPTDDVFQSYPDQAFVRSLTAEGFEFHLDQFVDFHISDNIPAYTADALRSVTSIPMVQGQVNVSSSNSAVVLETFAVQDAAIVQADILARNGVLHVVDRLLEPRFASRNFYSLIQQALDTSGNPQFSRFQMFIMAADRVGFLENLINATLLAPDDEAIADSDLLFYLDPVNEAELLRLVDYHVLLETLNVENLARFQTRLIPTQEGSTVEVFRSATQFRFNNGVAEAIDLVRRGLVYRINRLLTPP